MNEELLRALGVNVESAKEKAFTQGLLGSIFQAAALSGPQQRPVSTAQALGQVGLAGMGGYESAFDKTLKEAITGLQVKDMLRKQQEAEQLRTMLPNVFQVARGPATTRVLPAETGDIVENIPGAVTGVKVDPNRLAALMMVPGGIEAVKGIGEAQRLIEPKTSVQEIYDPQGRAMKVRYNESTGEYSPLGGAKAENFVQVDRGNVIELRRPSGEIIGTVAKEAAPVAPSFTMTDTGQILNTKTGQLLQPRDERGNPITIDTTAKASEDERKSGGFYLRMKDATSTINTPLTDASGKPILDKKGNSVTIANASARPEIFAEIVGGVLPNWMGGRAAQNFVTSTTRQQYQQAQENWVSANLRAESGAAIGVQEMEKEIRKYFPQVGEPEAVIAQKEKARAVAEQAMRQRAGRAISSQRNLSVDY